MIHIGNQTSCWASPPTLPFDYAVAHGFDAFEWFPDKKPDFGWDDTDLDEVQRRSIRETARTHGLRLSVHARWQANPLQSDALPGLSADLQLAQDLGAGLLNLHLWHEAGLDTFIDALTPLAHRIAEAGLQLAIENTPLHPPELFNELFARLCERKSFPALNVGMCLDLGHANLCAATLNNYLAFLDRLDAKVPLVHIHLHENWGDADSHLPLFTGPAARDDSGIRGFIERLQRRRFSGSIILEQWPQPPSLLNHARDRLHELISAPGRDAFHRVPDQEERERAGTRPHHTDEKANAEGNSERLIEVLSSSPPPAAHDFTAALISADRNARSWREKLEAVCSLLTSLVEHPASSIQHPASSILPKPLITLAIYLRFLGTGEIPCVEDGRHLRPGHHARIALEVQRQLAALTAPEAVAVARRLYRWLPSSAETFRSAEPLTRIRDIAHRNDIPADLKREIKHSLQNKLHRCAGPEDLVTSAALLERITAPGANYSASFVEQFRLFHEELKEFFNARSLDQRLEALLPHADAEQARLIQSFLAQKSSSSPTREVGSRTRTKNGTPDALTLLATLTDLRRSLLASANLAAASEDQARQQDRLLADIGLEDFAFVLLSRMLNTFEQSERHQKSFAAGPATQPNNAAPPASAPAMQELTEVLQLALSNLALSSVAPEECRALDSEISAWQKGFDPIAREQLLRLKASVDRSRRVAEDYSDRILALFTRQAETLGRALGVPEHAIRLYCEGEIRGHLVFQLSKLGSLMLRLLRQQLLLPAWDVIVAGETVGRVTLGAPGPLPASLSNPPLADKDAGAPGVIVLLDHAEGDEEIPNGVRAIVLAHEIPHLSHLSVRARQAGVVLIASDDRAVFEKVGQLQGETVSLVATPTTVDWLPQPHQLAANTPKRPTPLGRVRDISPEYARSEPGAPLSRHLRWLPLDKVVPGTGGPKAFGARRLAELARRKDAGFLTPHALVIPFAAQQDRVPQDIASVVCSEFGPDARLMVRSSANCEDLEAFSGAGLYESVANVAVSDLVSAIHRVSDSLRSARAISSRRQAGIPEESARMAVLIQQMLTPDYSFIIHTVNPINQNPREVYIELAAGLGETLASAAARGTPYRLACDKKSGEVTTLAFANFSQALEAAPASSGGVVARTLDYSQVELSRSSEARQALGRRLAAIARLVENAFQVPQDLEGAVVGNDIYLVQARPQQGL